MIVPSESRLTNGLRVLTIQDHFAPICAIAVAYTVGSCDESRGRTGLAHLVEHLMFKGSERVGQGEHAWLVYGEGGEMNANTNYDRTIFYEALPANQLDLGLFLEADRMRSLALTAENLDNARQAIEEEHRLAVEANPFGPTFETIKA